MEIEEALKTLLNLSETLDDDGSQHLAAAHALLNYGPEKDNAILMLSRIAEGRAFGSKAGDNRSRAVKELIDFGEMQRALDGARQIGRAEGRSTDQKKFAALVLVAYGDKDSDFDEAVSIAKALVVYPWYEYRELLGRALAARATRKEPEHPWKALWNEYDLERDPGMRAAFPPSFTWLATSLPNQEAALLSWRREIETDPRPHLAVIATTSIEQIAATK